MIVCFSPKSGANIGKAQHSQVYRKTLDSRRGDKVNSNSMLAIVGMYQTVLTLMWLLTTTIIYLLLILHFG